MQLLANGKRKLPANLWIFRVAKGIEMENIATSQILPPIVGGKLLNIDFLSI